MNEKTNVLSEGNLLKLKLYLLLVYCFLTVVVILWAGGSAEVLLQQLFLQIGSVFTDTSPSQVKP